MSGTTAQDRVASAGPGRPDARLGTGAGPGGRDAGLGAASELRVSDAERDAVAAELAEHLKDGRLPIAIFAARRRLRGSRAPEGR